MLNLKATTFQETAILNYLNENASETLTEKINNGTKTLSDCLNYIKEQARAEAKNGCAMIEDKVVYGWAVHYFEEEGIPGPVKRTEEKKPEIRVVEKPKAEKPKVEKKAAEPQLDGQTSIFDLLGV